MKLMSHTVFFGLQVAKIILVGGYFDAYIVDDFQPVGFQSYAFHGIVGYQAHLLHTQQAQYLCTTAVIALVGLET